MSPALAMSRLVLMVVFVTLSSLVGAANQPCSGKKGGIAGCVGEKFLCNDGSISGSKRVCSEGDGTTVRSSFKRSGVECSCSSGSYCIGPRGGKYCYTKSGRKSYL